MLNEQEDSEEPSELNEEEISDIRDLIHEEIEAWAQTHLAFYIRQHVDEREKHNKKFADLQPGWGLSYREKTNIDCLKRR